MRPLTSILAATILLMGAFPSASTARTSRNQLSSRQWGARIVPSTSNTTRDLGRLRPR